MKFDIFLSICQTEIDGFIPSERQMFENFFDQVKYADDLGFETAWVAETHLSCEIQKQNTNAVIPYFKGEIGLNTDILQLAPQVFSQTKKINIGSAIRNILCNGGPVAHAESLRTALMLNSLNNNFHDRKFEIGYASGRFEFSNRPYGIVPRNEIEKSAWPLVKNKILHQANEIFLRLLRGDELSSQDIEKIKIQKSDFRSEEDWRKAGQIDVYEIPIYWNFEKLGVIPKEAPLSQLQLTLGSHDPELQVKANSILPVRVFNLSITPEKVINETHERMQKCYHASGGSWKRHYMPRTAMVYINTSRQKAKQQAERAWENYWKAMEGTLDPKKVSEAVANTLAGTPEEVMELIKNKYHPDDRLMLWFDFNILENAEIKNAMKLFIENVAPRLN